MILRGSGWRQEKAGEIKGGGNISEFLAMIGPGPSTVNSLRLYLI